MGWCSFRVKWMVNGRPVTFLILCQEEMSSRYLLRSDMKLSKWLFDNNEGQKEMWTFHCLGSEDLSKYSQHGIRKVADRPLSPNSPCLWEILIWDRSKLLQWTKWKWVLSTRKPVGFQHSSTLITDAGYFRCCGTARRWTELLIWAWDAARCEPRPCQKVHG